MNVASGSRLKLKLVATVVLASFSCGCRDSGPFEYSPASGKVTYEDGSLIPAATIRIGFKALDHSGDLAVTPRPGKASVDVSDGTFDVVTSYKYGDGLIPGKHQVGVVALDDKGKVLKTIPREYTVPATSPITVDTTDAPFHIKIPKP